MSKIVNLCVKLMVDSEDDVEKSIINYLFLGGSNIGISYFAEDDYCTLTIVLTQLEPC